MECGRNLHYVSMVSGSREERNRSTCVLPVDIHQDVEYNLVEEARKASKKRSKNNRRSSEPILAKWVEVEGEGIFAQLSLFYGRRKKKTGIEETMPQNPK